MLPAAQVLWIALGIFLAPACTPFVALNQGTTPDLDLAELRCFATLFNQECHVTAIDGQRPDEWTRYRLTSLFPPGPHWLEITFRNNGFRPSAEVCAFEFDAQPAFVYYVRMNTLETVGEARGPVAAKRFEVIVGTPNARTIQKVFAMCASGPQRTCRDARDCPQLPKATCRVQDAFGFGLCVPNE